MKKFAALVLALALVLTSVSAFAAASRSVGNLTYATGVWDDQAISTNGALIIRPYDPLRDAEMSRILAADSIEAAFPAELADAVAGATDINIIVSVIIRADGELVATLVAPFAFDGNVVCLLGIYDANTEGYNYAALPTVINANGSATITMSADQTGTAATAASTILVFVQK